MKDFSDRSMLRRDFRIDTGRLRRTNTAAFARRGVGVRATTPEGLSNAFATDPSIEARWDVFVRNLSVPGPSLGDMVDDLRAWLMADFKPRWRPPLGSSLPARDHRSHPGSGRVFCAMVRSRPGSSRCGCFSGGL